MITTVCVIVHTDEDSQVQAEELTSKKLCFKCQSSNHESRNCPGSGAGKKIHALKIQDNTKFDRFKVETGACPVCKAEFHTWKKYGSGFDLVSNQVKDCPTFLGLATGQEKDVKLAALKGCASCTSFKHEEGQGVRTEASQLTPWEQCYGLQRRQHCQGVQGGRGGVPAHQASYSWHISH